MQKFKTFLYYCTIIPPIIKKIIDIINFFIEFNRTNKEVVQARNELKQLMEEARRAGYEFDKIIED
nr:hypothetical protein HHOCTOMJ_HHOCTOMJ_CDS_0009 [Microvirus sp.]